MSCITKLEDGYELIEIRSDFVSLTINPSRGNIFSSLLVDGEEWMYIVPENYHSKERPRCGCPVLFPFCGVNKDHLLQIQGKKYPTDIHGIVHTNQWTCVELIKETNTAVFQTSSNECTKQQFPFLFTLQARISVQHDRIIYEMTMINDSELPMQCDLGFHPFFKISKFAYLSFSTKSETAYDPVQKQLMKDSFLKQETINSTGCILMDQQKLQLEDKGKGYRLTFENEIGLRHFMLWSGNPDQFIVIEPLSGVPDAINDGINCFTIAAKQQKTCRWSLRFERLKA